MANYLDQNGLLYFWQQLKTLLAGKVDAVSGKGLSTNDFTNADATKLNGIATGAEVNIIDAITVNGTAASVSNKTAVITTATKTSQLTNDAGFITLEQVPASVQPSTDAPIMDGTATVGVSKNYARADHVHPTDSSRAPLASPTFVGTPKAPTPTAGTNNTQLATTAFVANAVSGKQNTLTFDSAPTAGSGNPVTSAGIYTALGNYLTTAAAASTYAKKDEIANAYIYRGSVETYADLPTTGLSVGDVYNVEATGANYAWDGTKWDSLGEIFTINAITNTQIDNIMAS